MDKLELIQEAAAAVGQAYCPYSKYRVGAALLTVGGEVFRGCNLENASYGLTVCAERSAFSAAITAGHREFKALAIVADGDKPYPCGACRQVIAEFCEPGFPVYVATTDKLGEFETLTLGELLPKSFGG